MDGVEVLEEKNQTRNSMVMISGHVWYGNGNNTMRLSVWYLNHPFKPIVEYGSQNYDKKQPVVENKILKKSQ
jgi:hypothetical protein